MNSLKEFILYFYQQSVSDTIGFEWHNNHWHSLFSYSPILNEQFHHSDKHKPNDDIDVWLLICAFSIGSDAEHLLVSFKITSYNFSPMTFNF